ncbi:reverse transcriptase domain-containing protein [Tanacetum coccineum]
MSVHNSEHNTSNNSDHDDDIYDSVTRISKLDISDPLHLHPNDTTALTVVSIKLKGTKNYQVWSCVMLLALEGRIRLVLLMVLVKDLKKMRPSGGSGLVCENYDFNGHTIIRCFKIIGYPADFGKKKFGQNFKKQSYSSNNSVGKSSSSRFTDEQMATLISLIKDNKVGKNMQANMTGLAIPADPVLNVLKDSLNIDKKDNTVVFLTIVDDYARAVWVYLIKSKDEGYEDAIVVPEITADNFELKHGLLTLVQNKQFFGYDKEDPHAHIRYFSNITSTMKFPNVLRTSVKLMLFPFSLEGAARIWLEKEPPRSILTWDDLDRFNDLLRACPHRGFLELHQLDTFYNALNSNDQDSLNSAAGGNFLDKMPRDCLRIIESKSKVHNSRNKPIVAKVSASNSTPGISPDVAELKDMVKALLLDKKNQTQAPAPVKAVEESCVTCGGAHSYRNCPATDGNVYRDNIQEYVSQAAAVNYN